MIVKGILTNHLFENTKKSPYLEVQVGYEVGWSMMILLVAKISVGLLLEQGAHPKSRAPSDALLNCRFGGSMHKPQEFDPKNV